MEQSEKIENLAAALAKAQGEIGGAIKSATNPHLKSKYANMESVLDAVRKPLTANGISVVQMPGTVTHENGTISACLTTQITHASGEWMRGTLEIPLVGKHDAQAYGSALTYARRYALMAVCGVAPEDDDGHAASQGKPAEAAKPAQAQAQSKPDKGADAETKRRDQMRIRFDEVCNEIAKTTDDRKQGVIGNALANVKLWYGVSRVSALTDQQFDEFLKRLWDEATAPASA